MERMANCRGLLQKVVHILDTLGKYGHGGGGQRSEEAYSMESLRILIFVTRVQCISA